MLDRTADDRSQAPNDAALARTLAGELGGLALGLEQAGAHIATERIGFARYLALWNAAREAALGWSDPVVTGSEKTLATVWTTSVARLTPESRRLLDRLAYLAPDPIPDSLLDVAVPGEAAQTAATSARAGLYAYSLIARATQEGGGAPGFIVHRLVQDFARRAMSEERRSQALREALEWVNAAFVGGPARRAELANPRSARAARARGRAPRATRRRLRSRPARLFNQLGALLYAKADYAEAEPLVRRAFAIDEKSYGPDHPEVANHLNNLAQLLQATNRLAEAEPLMRRALAIDEKSYGPDHPNVARHLNNLAQLLQATNRLAEAEPLMRRALAIDEKSYGPDHPNVARGLNNLAELLQRHEPPRRGRATVSPRARDRRNELWPGSSRMWRPTSTISRCCFRPRTASPRPSR